MKRKTSRKNSKYDSRAWRRWQRAQYVSIIFQPNKYSSLCNMFIVLSSDCIRIAINHIYSIYELRNSQSCHTRRIMVCCWTEIFRDNTVLTIHYIVTIILHICIASYMFTTRRSESIIDSSLDVLFLISRTIFWVNRLLLSNMFWYHYAYCNGHKCVILYTYFYHALHCMTLHDLFSYS